MKSKRLKLSSLLLFGISLNVAFSQEVIQASGANVVGASGSISYSVGQSVSATNTGTDGTVISGVQQPYEISVLSGINEKKIKLGYVIYPNPTTDFLKLTVDESATFSSGSITYQLSDINGKILGNRNITNNEIIIKMTHFTTGIYFLRIFQGNTEKKSFKIIKH